MNWSRKKCSNGWQKHWFLTDHKTLWHEQLPVEKKDFRSATGRIWATLDQNIFAFKPYYAYILCSLWYQESNSTNFETICTHTVFRGKKNEFCLILPKGSVRRRQNILSLCKLTESPKYQLFSKNHKISTNHPKSMGKHPSESQCAILSETNRFMITQHILFEKSQKM